MGKVKEVEFIKREDIPEEPPFMSFTEHLFIDAIRISGILMALYGVLDSIENAYSILNKGLIFGGGIWYSGLTTLKTTAIAKYQSEVSAYENAKTNRRIFNKGFSELEKRLSKK
jgi:hypothetical protein